MNAISKVLPVFASPAQREELFAEAKTYAAERQEMGRAARHAGWVVGGVGTFVGVVGMCAVIALLPLKQTEFRYLLVDRNDGTVGESVAAVDAPKLFTDQVAAQYLRQYIEAREGYVPETDDLMFRKVAVMSAPEEQRRYAAWHTAPTSPRALLSRSGHIRVENFRPVLQGTGKDKTIVYTVRYDRTELRGTTAGPRKPWTATIQFQWHPEQPSNLNDRQLNPAGLQVIAYQADPDGGV